MLNVQKKAPQYPSLVLHCGLLVPWDTFLGDQRSKRERHECSNGRVKKKKRKIKTFFPKGGGRVNHKVKFLQTLKAVKKSVPTFPIRSL